MADRWRWVTRSDGRLSHLEDADENYLVSSGSDDDVDVPSPRVRALTEAAPEMFELLRVLGYDPGRSVTNCHVTYPCSCERHRARALLARIDAAGKRAFCPDCGAELTWPKGQDKPWSCGPCNEDQS